MGPSRLVRPLLSAVYVRPVLFGVPTTPMLVERVSLEMPAQEGDRLLRAIPESAYPHFRPVQTPDNHHGPEPEMGRTGILRGIE
jgi:hypothetical protein